MPIEFACEECGSVLQVPDGSSGKRSRCPTCKHEQVIPWVVSDAQDAAAAGKLSIPCPKCQHHLVCSPDLIGTRGQCKKCQHIFTISTEPAASELAAPALVFHCPECQQLFEGREEMRGRKGKCHVCQAVFKIVLEPAQPKTEPSTSGAKPSEAASPSQSAANPAVQKTKPADPQSSSALLPKAPKTAAPQPHEDEELLIAEDPEPKPRQKSTPTPKASTPQANQPKPKPTAPAGPIRFECRQCSGVMEVPGSTAGLETECPYCQTVQTIPATSTPISTPQVASYSTSAPNYAAPAYSANSYAQPAAPQPAYDPLDGLDLSLTNPYAAPAQTWSAPAARSGYSSNRTQLSVGNVLQLGFESLFPSCLAYLLHMVIFGFSVGIMYLILLAVLFSLRNTGEVGVYIAIGSTILFAVGMGLMSAYMAGALSRMALDAVRKRPFNLGDALNPGGAFSAAIMVAGGGVGIMVLAYLPIILQATTGVLKGMEFLIIGWFLLFIPIMMIYGFGTSLALFAGADGEESSVAIQTSMSLVFGNFGTTFAVMFITGLITGVLALPTLGTAYVIPVYMSAALYHLAKKNS